MKHRLIALLLITLWWAGCVSTSVTPLTGRKYPALTPEEVTLYLSEEDVPGRFEKVAVIYARGDYAMTDEAMMHKKVRQQAARLGANGVLIRGIREPSTGAKVAQAIIGTSANRRGEMIAIYVYPESGK